MGGGIPAVNSSADQQQAAACSSCSCALAKHAHLLQGLHCAAMTGSGVSKTPLRKHDLVTWSTWQLSPVWQVAVADVAQEALKT